MLYIPRGHVHAARTVKTTSVHLSVGIHPKTWIDLFASAVDAARSDSRFRAALPPGYFNGSEVQERFKELAAALSPLLDAEYALGHLAQKWFVAPTPPPDGDFLADDVELTPETVIKVRKDFICRAFQGKDHAGVQYSGGRIVGPAKVGPALRKLFADRRLAVRDLAENLTEREAKVLATRLVRDGLLEVESKGAEDA
jgi:hypothetical protein